MAKYLLVMLGGALGAVSRFVVATLVSHLYTSIFPLGTFLINVSGSFLIGLLMMLFVNRPEIHTNWRVFLVTGVLGGYTTFSSFEWEIFAAMRAGAAIVGILYILASVALGLGGVWVGAVISHRLWPQ